jgi:hypothetical protein
MHSQLIVTKVQEQLSGNGIGFLTNVLEQLDVCMEKLI